MTPAELERANTWLLEIGDALESVEWHQEGDQNHAVGQGGLPINLRKGGWHQHSTHKGRRNALLFVAHLRSCNAVSATKWLALFLTSYPGSGTVPAGDAEDREIDRAPTTLQIIDTSVSPEATPAATDLWSRNILGPIPDFIKYLPNARCGEGAMGGLLARDYGVGVQIGYRDPDDRKQLLLPTVAGSCWRRHQRHLVAAIAGLGGF